MTARQVFEGVLTELSKVKTPSLLLQDFNYFFNKAINSYVNKEYNICEINLQSTDDLRVLKASTVLVPNKTDLYNTLEGIKNLYGTTFELELPTDYLHTLNCICVYQLANKFKCYDEGEYVLFAARRLTADSWGTIINDFYNRPLPTRPYYYINNVNTSTTLPTNPYVPNKGTLGTGTDISKVYDNTTLDGTVSTDSINLARTLNIAPDTERSLIEKDAAVRYGNSSSVRMEIRYGKDTSVFKLVQVLLDYIKAPLYIRLTLNQIDTTLDTSQIMEFPDYVCQEIINELVELVMENTQDPRLQTHIPVSLSIANPAQQLTAKK